MTGLCSSQIPFSSGHATLRSIPWKKDPQKLVEIMGHIIRLSSILSGVTLVWKVGGPSSRRPRRRGSRSRRRRGGEEWGGRYHHVSCPYNALIRVTYCLSEKSWRSSNNSKQVRLTNTNHRVMSAAAFSACWIPPSRPGLLLIDGGVQSVASPWLSRL